MEKNNQNGWTLSVNSGKDWAGSFSLAGLQVVTNYFFIEALLFAVRSNRVLFLLQLPKWNSFPSQNVLNPSVIISCSTGAERNRGIYNCLWRQSALHCIRYWGRWGQHSSQCTLPHCQRNCDRWRGETNIPNYCKDGGRYIHNVSETTIVLLTEGAMLVNLLLSDSARNMVI